jgi:hypothetical protein
MNKIIRINISLIQAKVPSQIPVFELHGISTNAMEMSTIGMTLGAACGLERFNAFTSPTPPKQKQ